jgi:fibronectin type 3 domain-containing protein
VNFMATALPPSISLSWTASTSPNIIGYNVYRASVSGGPYTLVNSSLVAGTSYVDNTVSSSQTYYYVTTAVDSSNDQSGYSNQAAASVP